MGGKWKQWQILFSWAPKSLQTSAPWKKSCDTPRQCIKKSRYHFANKGLYSQNYDFSGSHVWMSDLDHKEGWALKSWCFQVVVLEKTLESPTDSKEIKPANPKGHQPWIFTGLMLKVKVQYFGYHLTHWKRPWFWERLKAGGEGDGRGWDG